MSDRAIHQTSGGNKQLKERLLDTALELFQQSHQWTWLPFVGTSMSPYIKEGDMLLVQHAPRPIRLGDVVVFKRAGRFIAHRVVFMKKQCHCERGEANANKRVYRTKGDNLCSFDALVPQSSVLGRVVRIQTNNRTISLENLHAKLFSFGSALYSYAYGIFYQLVKRFCRKWKDERQEI